MEPRTTRTPPAPVPGSLLPPPPPRAVPEPPPLPVASLGYATPAGYADAALWREGNRLVAVAGGDRTVHLPDRCVKCNAPADGRWPWSRTLYWHHPAYYLLILPGLLVYAVVALSVRKKVVVRAGLCAAHRAQRRNRILLAWGIALAGVVPLAAAIYFAANPPWRHGPLGPVFALAGTAMILFAAVYAIVAVRVVTVRKVTADHVWFSGAGPEFLALLPAA